jgi:hypothetical protein
MMLGVALRAAAAREEAETSQMVYGEPAGE